MDIVESQCQRGNELSHGELHSEPEVALQKRTGEFLQRVPVAKVESICMGRGRTGEEERLERWSGFCKLAEIWLVFFVIVSWMHSLEDVVM